MRQFFLIEKPSEEMMNDAIVKLFSLVYILLTLHEPNIVPLVNIQGCGLWKIEGGHCSKPVNLGCLGYDLSAKIS